MNNLDSLCKQSIDNAPNSVVAWILITSYLYYHCHESIISDELFDRMCRQYIDQCDTIMHMHKHLIDVESMRAGTMYHLVERDYPNIVKGAAYDLVKKLYE